MGRVTFNPVIPAQVRIQGAGYLFCGGNGVTIVVIPTPTENFGAGVHILYFDPPRWMFTFTAAVFNLVRMRNLEGVT